MFICNISFLPYYLPNDWANNSFFYISNPSGAVGCIRDIGNPVSFARTVMEKTPHCLLVGEGAMKFAEKVNYPILKDPNELITKDSVCKSFLHGSGIYHSKILKPYIVTEIKS